MGADWRVWGSCGYQELYGGWCQGMVGPAVGQGHPVFCDTISSPLPASAGTGKVQCLAHRLTFICGTSAVTLPFRAVSARRWLIAAWPWGREGTATGSGTPHITSHPLMPPHPHVYFRVRLLSGIALPEMTPWWGSEESAWYACSLHTKWVLLAICPSDGGR